MGRKKSTPEPQKPWNPGKRPVLFIEGNYHYLSTTGVKAAKYKSVFENDPKGCFGFGATKEGARAMLYDYAEEHGEEY